MTRGRRPQDNTGVMAMFRLQYDGESASQALESDLSLSKEQKWQLLFDKNWNGLAPLSQRTFLVALRRWKAWIEAHPDLPYGYLVYPSSKVSAFLQDLLNTYKARNSKDPLGNIKAARKALRHLRACQTGLPDEQEELPHQPLVAGVTSRAKAATTEARRGEDADPSSCASTLSDEEYASVLDAAMRYPDQQVGLCVAAMVSTAFTMGFRSDDLQDTRFFLELVTLVKSDPLPMQVVALAHNGGKANQDGQTTYGALASHKQPMLDSLVYLGQHVLYQLNITGIPLLQLIFQSDTSWRLYRVFHRDPSTAQEKQSYYDLSTMLLRVLATLRDPLVKVKVMHLMRCSGLVQLAAAGCSIDTMRVWGRYATGLKQHPVSQDPFCCSCEASS